MMGRFLMVARLMMFGRFVVMFRRVAVMFGGLLVMLYSFLGHDLLPR